MGELLDGDPRVERAPMEAEKGARWRIARDHPRAPATPPAALDYVVVDVETTGTSPRKGDRVTEIAAVEVSGGEVVGEFSSLVNPGRPIPPPVSRLTGITDDLVRDAPPFDEIADRVRKRLEGRIFVAHNVPFDWRFVSHELRRSRAVVPVGPRLCTLRLARRALPGLPRKGLDAVCRYYAIEIEDRHRALGDSLATAALLMRLIEEGDRLGVGSWSDLRAWLDGGPPPAHSGTEARG